MSNLLKTEIYKLFHSWYFWGIGIFNLLLSSILLLDSKECSSNLIMASLYNIPLLYFLIMEKENNNIIFTIENPMSDSSEIDCNRLFDRFYTGDKSRHNGSTGLGLAVVKTLVAILGGNIVAKVHANSLIITLEL